MSEQAMAEKPRKNDIAKHFDDVLKRVMDMEADGSVQFPANYSYVNALKSAWLILQKTTTSKNEGSKPVLEYCTRESIANSLLNMVVQGLNPIKNQCYFIAYGKELQLSRSYLGNIAMTKRLEEVEDVKGYALYEGDEFEVEFDLETGNMRVSKYKTSLKNINGSKLTGAFAYILGKDGPLHLEVMTLEQIRAAWNQGQMKGGSGAHKNFTEEMAKKTVINRACKMYTNTSDDSDILMDAIHNTVEHEINENANKEYLEIEGDVIEVETDDDVETLGMDDTQVKMEF